MWAEAKLPRRKLLPLALSALQWLLPRALHTIVQRLCLHLVKGTLPPSSSPWRETEAKRNDHLGPESWLPNLGHRTLLATLATPEQVRGTLATSSFSRAKPEPGRRGRGRVCTLGGGGAIALPGSRRRVRGVGWRCPGLREGPQLCQPQQSRL